MRAVVPIASVSLSAFLLFAVQPMVAKALLPAFGGGPAVWNTSLVFFQLLLLAGYAYSDALSRRASARAVLVVHAVLVLASLLALPPALDAARATPPAASAWPLGTLLVALATAVGPTFFVLATNSTLTQGWESRRTAREPYALFAASNLGSLAALLLYPLLLEPRLGLRAQSRAWAVGYALFTALTLAQLARNRRAPAAAPVPAAAAPAARPGTPRVTAAQRARWVFRSAVSSLLLLAVTMRITSDVASVPLLWTLPLGLYLLTYVLAFAPRVPFPRALLEIVALYCVTFGMNVWPFTHITALAWVLAPPLGALLFGGWVVHGDLYRDRPADLARLGEFYLANAAGGALGGMFASLVAPRVFASVAEYPLALALLAAALAFKSDQGASLRVALRRARTWAGPALAALLVAGAYVASRAGWLAGPASVLAAGAPAAVLIAAVALWRVPGLYAGVALVVAVFVATGAQADSRQLASVRSFFGVVRVREASGLRMMTHGTTLHGIQRVAPHPSDVPGTYYHPDTPMGAAVARARAGARIGVVGLGTGSLAVLLAPGQRMTYYELDPSVEPLARRYFTFLPHSRGDVSVVVGDARLTLAREPAHALDLLVIDAFASDAIPVHLLTLEAVRLYFDKLAPGGAVLLHVSHRYLDLARVIAGAAGALRLASAIANYAPPDALAAEGVRANTVVALARDATTLEALPAGGARWQPLRAERPVVWTDDRSSLLDVLGVER